MFSKNGAKIDGKTKDNSTKDGHYVYFFGFMFTLFSIFNERNVPLPDLTILLKLE